MWIAPGIAWPAKRQLAGVPLSFNCRETFCCEIVLRMGILFKRYQRHQEDICKMSTVRIGQAQHVEPEIALFININVLLVNILQFCLQQWTQKAIHLLFGMTRLLRQLTTRMEAGMVTLCRHLRIISLSATWDKPTWKNCVTWTIEWAGGTPWPFVFVQAGAAASGSV